MTIEEIAEAVGGNDTLTIKRVINHFVDRKIDAMGDIAFRAYAEKIAVAVARESTRHAKRIRSGRSEIVRFNLLADIPSPAPLELAEAIAQAKEKRRRKAE